MSMVIGAPYLGTSEKMLAMRLFTCFLQLMPGLALPAVSPQQLAVSAENNSSEVEVVPFQDVWARSYCRVLEKLVNVVSEYPEEMQYMFNPSCVSLLRCSGCCGDESLRCMPVETYNVTMQIVRMSSEERPTYVEMSFTQHSHWKTEALSLSNRLINRDTFLLTSGPTATALKVEPGHAWPVWEKVKPERRRPKGSGKKRKVKKRATDCHLCGDTDPQR